jgi:hypothetical protein
MSTGEILIKSGSDKLVGGGGYCRSLLEITVHVQQSVIPIAQCVNKISPERISYTREISLI